MVCTVLCKETIGERNAAKDNCRKESSLTTHCAPQKNIIIVPGSSLNNSLLLTYTQVSLLNFSLRFILTKPHNWIGQNCLLYFTGRFVLLQNCE